MYTYHEKGVLLCTPLYNCPFLKSGRGCILPQIVLIELNSLACKFMSGIHCFPLLWGGGCSVVRVGGKRLRGGWGVVYDHGCGASPPENYRRLRKK